MSPAARFQETLRRLAIFDEGIATAGFGPDLGQTSALDDKTMALLQGRLRAEHLKTHLLELDLSRRSRQGSMLVCAAMSQTRPHLGEPGP